MRSRIETLPSQGIIKPVSTTNKGSGKVFRSCIGHHAARVKRDRRLLNLAAALTNNQHEGRNAMPLIQVRVIKDVFSKEQKHQIINKLTDAMVSIEGENMRGVTWCVVEEVESGDWGIGGNALTTADVHALARGKAA
jgi:4-oxalocrotonate tautomerase